MSMYGEHVTPDDNAFHVPDGAWPPTLFLTFTGRFIPLTMPISSLTPASTLLLLSTL